MEKLQIAQIIEKHTAQMDENLGNLSFVLSQMEDNQQAEHLQTVFDTLSDVKLILEKLVITLNIDSKVKKPTLIESRLAIKNSDANEVLVWRTLDIDRCLASLSIAISQISDDEQAEYLEDAKRYFEYLGKELRKLTHAIHSDEKRKNQTVAKSR